MVFGSVRYVLSDPIPEQQQQPEQIYDGESDANMARASNISR